MTMNRRQTLAVLMASTLPVAMPHRAQSQEIKVRLVVGTQDGALQETVTASKVLEGTPYDVQWALLPGPAAQLSALYSGAVDLGHMGDTSLIIEQSRAKAEWTDENVPLQIVAGWRNNNPDYPPAATIVRTNSGIKTLADLRGRKWAFNYGGYAYLQYVLTRIKAGLKTTDYEPVKFVDANAAAAAFNSGSVDVYSGAPGRISELLTKGEARFLITGADLDLPALNVWTARREVIRDPARSEALADFLGRVRKHWSWYAANLDTVERLYIERLKQSPGKAKYWSRYGSAEFIPFDDALIAAEQRIANVLLEAGDIPRAVNVDIEFSRKFNAATIGTG